MVGDGIGILPHDLSFYRVSNYGLRECLILLVEFRIEDTSVGNYKLPCERTFSVLAQ